MKVMLQVALKLLITTSSIWINNPLAMAGNVFQDNAATNFKSDYKKEIYSFKDEEQKSAYALGASLGRYIEKSLKEQENLGIYLDKIQMMSGLNDTLANKIKLPDEEIEATLRSFEDRVKKATVAKIEKDSKENFAKGTSYANNFAKKKGVKKTQSGLLYQIETAGKGNIPKNTDTVIVNYKGTLIDGTEFDNSYKRGQPLSVRLDRVIPGWTEGLKYIKKGGKIKLVIPPNLAYGKSNVPGIPTNSMLVFDIELIDIKPTTNN